MAKYQKYAEYQDSGIEWLGEIPKDWEVLKLKYVLDLISEKSQDNSQKYVGMENIASKTGKYVHTEEVIPEGISNTFKENDVLFGKLRPYLAKSWLASFSGICSSELLVLRAKEVCPKFLQYYTLTDEFINQVDSSTYGSKMPRASWEFISLLPLPKCSYELSLTIANFLDHETAQIDSLIAKQEKLIELLKEKRQAVISHAVTKGLNPDVSMKDSGVEWLGQVPEHWAITSVRNLIRSGNLLLQDGNHGEIHPTANDYVEEGIPFLMANNVRNGKLLMDDVKRIPKSIADKLRIGFAKQGDMLLTHKGTVGEVALVPHEIEEEYWMLTPQVTYYRWNSQEFLSQYFYYQFQSTSIQNQLEIIGGKQSTRAYVGLIAQGDLMVAIPPIDEQIQVASSILEKDQSYQVMIEKAQSAIKLMQERRTALISSAVTGKIDVRNWQHPNEAKTEFSA